jgi:hypothetical protein
MGNPLLIKDNNPIAIKEHFIKNMNDFNNKSKLILILRDFNECIIRHNNNLTEKFIDDYFDLIKFYDKFKGEKMICYYDDLIKNPQKVSIQLYNFYNLDDKKRLDDFIENHEKYAKQNKNVKNRQWNGSISGNDLNFHKKTIKNLKNMNNYIDSNYKELKKYTLDIWYK